METENKTTLDTEQNQLDKIKLAFSRMDNDYWNNVSVHSANLSEEVTKITAAINDNFTKLSIIQLDILNAKYKGYERLILSEKNNTAEIIKENKNCIDELTNQKNQITTTISDLQTKLNSAIKEMQTLIN